MQIVKSRTVTWLDIESPSWRDIHRLVRDFNIPSHAANHLKEPVLRPTVETLGKVLYVVLHFPIFNPAKQTSESAELDFIITPSMLLTARYRAIEPFDTVLKRCSSLPLKNAEYCLARGPIFLFYHIVKEIFNFSLREIDHIQEKISDIEEGIFDGREKEMVSRISLVTRDIINFSSTLTPQRTVLENLLERTDAVDAFTRPYIADLVHEYRKIFDLVKSKQETIQALHATNESLLNAKTNEVMKVLTIMAFVTFPLMLLTSLFGMNTKVLPIVGAPNDFWIIIGIMATATLGFFIFFKRKKWL